MFLVSFSHLALGKLSFFCIWTQNGKQKEKYKCVSSDENMESSLYLIVGFASFSLSAAQNDDEDYDGASGDYDELSGDYGTTV